MVSLGSIILWIHDEKMLKMGEGGCHLTEIQTDTLDSQLYKGKTVTM